MTFNYWNDRYKNQETGWDIGFISSPLKAYFDQLSDKNLKILIPGAGNAYEAEYLHSLGFKNIYVIDIAPLAIENLVSRCPDFPQNHLILGDFFSHEGEYDLIVEQTFFCAIAPKRRNEYAQKMKSLLKSEAKFVGLFFDRAFDGGPPFGGSKREYIELFENYFDMVSFEDCYNSIPSRAGTEVFAVLMNK